VSKYADDRYRVMDLLENLSGDQDMQVLVIDGEPSSMRGKLAQFRYIEAFKRFDRQRGSCCVVCLFYRRNHKRTDVDNMLKCVLDAATKAKVWEDDCQVTALLGSLELDRDNPRLVIGISKHESTLNRSRDIPFRWCSNCGGRFKPKGKQRYCTVGCIENATSRNGLKAKKNYRPDS
jgi:hypothetical protein